MDVTESDDEVLWEECEVTGSLVGGSDARLDVERSMVRSVTFTGAHFAEFTATDTVFEGCELSAANLDGANLSRVEFRRCRMRAMSLGGGRLRDLRFVDCQLDDASLRLCRGEYVGFESSTMCSADLYGTELFASYVFDTDLTGSELSQVKLPGARLHGSTLHALRGAEHLRGVVIDSTQAVSLGLLLLGSSGISVDDDRERNG